MAVKPPFPAPQKSPSSDPNKINRPPVPPFRPETTLPGSTSQNPHKKPPTHKGGGGKSKPMNEKSPVVSNLGAPNGIGQGQDPTLDQFGFPPSTY